MGRRIAGRSQLTSAGVTATAIYYQELEALERVAALLGITRKMPRSMQDEAGDVKDAFNARFFHADTNQYDTGSQTANAMPLVSWPG